MQRGFLSVGLLEAFQKASARPGTRIDTPELENL
jgi:hypothetical protein